MNRTGILNNKIALLIIILIFIAVQIPFINRPLYWDEAWSYGPAMKAMYDNGPSLLPHSISAWLSRGHPLFFYFLFSSWMHIAGTSMVSIHIFALLISVLLIIYVYKTAYLIAGARVALISAILIASFHVVLEEATYMLPEILIALLTIMLVYYFLRKNIFLEALVGSVLVLTKETGVIIVGGLILFHIYNSLAEKGKKTELKQLLISILKHSIPIFVSLMFYVVQKIERGWFFYPEHIGMLDLHWDNIVSKASDILKNLYVFKGQIIIAIPVVTGLFCLICKKSLGKKETGFIILSLIIAVPYIIFSAINFYTLRYILAIVPFVVIINGMILAKISEKYRYVSVIVLALFMVFNVYYFVDSYKNSISYVGFVNMIKANEKMVEYCEKENLYDEAIFPNFLMQYNMKHPFLGYLKSDKVFNITGDFDKARYIILSANEPAYPNKNMVSDTSRYKLLKAIHINDEAWCEIYIRL